MSTGNFFRQQSRCTSKHPTTGVRCERSHRHSGSCSALELSTGQFVRWDYRKQWTRIELGEPPKAIPKETRTTPVASWRWWRIGHRGILQSMTSGSLWRTPVMTTKTLPDGSLARVAKSNPRNGYQMKPNEDWGVYSYKTPKFLHTYAPYLFDRSRYGKGFLVLGRIDNFGHIIEHDYGYRAQRVIVQELWLFHTHTEAIFNTGWKKATENRYECPVHFVHWDKLSGWIEFYSDPEENEDAEDSEA